MTRLFVYELLSGGGAGTPATPDEAAALAELMPMGVSMRDAMVEDLCALPGVRVTTADCAAAPCRRDGVRVERPGPGEDPFAFVARHARAADAVWLVAPETGGLLARFEAAVTGTPGAGRWLGSTGEAIRAVSSKTRTMDRLAGVGLATPLAFANDPDVRRWVVKPDDGAGAVDTVVCTRRADAEHLAAQRTARHEAVMLQPWVEGEALSLSLLAGGGRPTELLSINRQHITVDEHGVVAFRGVTRLHGPPWDTRRAALAALAEAVVGAVPGLRGFVGIDLVWHEHAGPVVIEVNPRVSCAYVGLSAHLGRPLAAEVLARHGVATALEAAP